MGGHPQKYELFCHHYFFKGTRRLRPSARRARLKSGACGQNKCCDLCPLGVNRGIPENLVPPAALWMFDAVASWWICLTVWWVTTSEVSMEVLSWWWCKLGRVPTCVHLNRRLMALLKGPSCSGPLVHKPHLRAERLSSASVQLPPGATCTQSHARDPR